jgi:glycosyltransferase A (GT-A) superfamily protein (DUF2064 family)
VELGMTRKQARAAFPRSSLHAAGDKDFFCLTPSGVDVGYATAALLKPLSSRQRKQLQGRVVWIWTADRSYAIDRIDTGAASAAAKRALPNGTVVSARGDRWYFARAGSATAAFELRGGHVVQVGIAAPQLTRDANADRRFISGF